MDRAKEGPRGDGEPPGRGRERAGSERALGLASMYGIRQLARIAGLVLVASGPLSACASSAIDPEFDVEEDAGAVEDGGNDGGTRQDAGGPAPDGGVRDSGARDAGPRDASSQPPVDASPPKDAGTDAESKPSDAGSPADAGADAGPEDAGEPPECVEHSDCKQVCFVGGLFPCCRPNQTCGCTIIPGAFCI